MKYNIKKMKFSVIYSFDIPATASVSDFLPVPLKAFKQTEGDKQYELDIWEKGKHRKLIALLNFRQFEKFIQGADLVADSSQTMGSIGAPGCPYWAPAISFYNPDAQEGFKDAYVTPLPAEDPPEGDEALTKAWEEVEALMQARYGRDSFWSKNGYMKEDS